MRLTYRFLSYLRHTFTAWNSTGEGIHSPYLYYIVRFIIRDQHSYYCFPKIERRRSALLSDTDMLDVVDYGSCGSPSGKHVRRRVCDIARWQLENAKVQQLLFRLVNYTHEVLQRPLDILELGTSLGIGTAYLASADSRNKVVTFEGSASVADKAQEQWNVLGLTNISCVKGRIEDTLYKYARERIDFAYVDANHTYEATMEYVRFLLPRMSEKGMVVIDDIHYTPDMQRAWEELKNNAYVTSSMDLYHIGILFVDKHYLKKHYKIRI